MSQAILTIVVAIIGSSAFSTVIQIFVNKSDAKKREKSEENKTMRKVMEALAHDAYFRQARFLLNKDVITEEELENHNYLYSSYHALGLNSTGDRMHELVMEKKVQTFN